jgi:hypothetical protein
VNEEALARVWPQRHRKKKKNNEFFLPHAVRSVFQFMIKRLILEGTVAVYCKVVRYTPNRIHGQNAEFVKITYILTVSLVTMGFNGLTDFEDFVFLKSTPPHQSFKFFDN